MQLLRAVTATMGAMTSFHDTAVAHPPNVQYHLPTKIPTLLHPPTLCNAHLHVRLCPPAELQRNARTFHHYLPPYL
jgi:hypothetical protein